MTPTKMLLSSLIFVVTNFLHAGAGYQMGCNYFLSPLHITAPTVIGTIRLPIIKGQIYLPNQHCEWIIKTQDPDHVIQVYIKTCSVQGPRPNGDCLKDYLDFYEVKQSGDQIFMGRYCGGKCEGRLLETTSSNMMIHFISDDNFQYRGFELTYMAQPKKEQEAEDKSTTALAVGISAGLVSLGMAVIVIICFYRRWFASKNSRSDPSSSSSSTSCQRSRDPLHVQQQEPSIHPQLIASERRQGDRIRYDTPSDVNYNPTSPENLPAYLSHNVGPLRVDIPLENSDLHSQVQRRSSSSSTAFSPVPTANRTSVTGISGAYYNGGDDGDGVNRSLRSQTPPPSYEFTVMHDRMVRQQQGGDAIVMPEFPPDYDSVVKRNDFESQI